MRTPLTAVCLLVAGILQAQGDRPSFEVASIKRNNSGTTIANAGRTMGDRFTAANATVIQLLRTAYGVQEYQIEGQPGWTGVERFDINAKIAPGSKAAEWPVMLQSLLADRFRLRLHRGQKETNVYALVAARGGVKLTSVDPAKCAPPGGSCGFTASPTEIVARGQSMEQLAMRLSRSVGQTVVNRTGIGGIFDFRLEWTQEDQFRSAGATASPTIFTALAEQLGLRLQGERAPIEVLIVDSVERPTPD